MLYATCASFCFYDTVIDMSLAHLISVANTTLAFTVLCKDQGYSQVISAAETPHLTSCYYHLQYGCLDDQRQQLMAMGMKTCCYSCLTLQSCVQFSCLPADKTQNSRSLYHCYMYINSVTFIALINRKMHTRSSTSINRAMYPCVTPSYANLLLVRVPNKT